MAGTLYDKLWEAHIVAADESGQTLLYIDRQLLHEVSSPQAFAGLRAAGIEPHRPHTQLAVADHAVPTHDRGRPIANAQARDQIALIEANCAEFGIEYLALDGTHQGIVHVIGPEQGFTLPGITLVCGDSHSATHGAFGALAFGIGASECETVLATQTLWQQRASTMRVTFVGKPMTGVGAKDMILALIGRIGASGAVGHAIEYTGEAVTALSMEARMTLCNMSIEAGSRTGLIAPDATTFAYLKDRPRCPSGALWEHAVASWRGLASAPDAMFDREVTIHITDLAPQVSFGTSPDQVLPIDGRIPDPADCTDEGARDRLARALDYMALMPGTAMTEVAIDHVFIGSCTNGRIEDLRAAAAIVGSGHVAQGVRALVVPGSGAVKRQAESEGLDRIFTAAGFEWREAGCSLCVAMNDDRLPPGARCASTSNRNFEGRQGMGARTHLVSPAMAAAAALAGHFVDIRTR
ncbi:3-isopropylmalate dehydratase large subunit [Sphingomonas sp. AR_OL41]|uniref:3-isopropylmalate dehydratase large subunit n=1 Tax=Sphingomonas sp. AR_OL41 TaxID=3042729 RepID=UPI00247FB968|nr:3-isopropylmalate dehydratase large subunit [Sphingomonas sp. AR_OL41]MDH7973216.1 3-isopropylmalate dehydratase large subunit [Sphingomonas sp. AR_OL41]